jgi:stearoyl-CoA desaturase (delta-9 desaturase)
MGALTGFIWGGVVRFCLVAQQISFLNSFNHMMGTRPFKMRDNKSHNIALFGLLSWGEGWHNNHHAFPSSANFGYRWYHIDFGYYLIKTLESLGLAWDVRKPNRKAIERKLARYEEALAETKDKQTVVAYDFDQTDVAGARVDEQ